MNSGILVWFKPESKPWEYVTLPEPKSGTLAKIGETYRF
jgi:hypothetical protein